LIRSIRYAIERKKTEEALEEARNELEERVRLRTRELNELNKELQAEIVSRKIAEEKLRENEARLNWRNESLTWILGLDIRTNELYWSDEIYTIFGLDPHTFIPTTKRS